MPRPDPVMGEVGVAVVVPADPAAPPTLDDLRAFLDGRLAAYKLPEALRSSPSCPSPPCRRSTAGPWRPPRRAPDPFCQTSAAVSSAEV